MTIEALRPGDVDRPTRGSAQSRAADEIIARLEQLPFTRFHQRIAGVLAVGTFSDAFDSVSIAAALTVIFTSLKIDFVNAGLLLSSAYVGQFVGAISFGYLSERYGRRRAFALALAAFGVLSLCAAFAQNFQQLLVIRLVQGVGLGAEVPIAGALFNEFVRGKTRGKVVMLYESVFNWGLLITPLVAIVLFGVLGQELGWRVLFAIGGLPIVIAVLAWRRLPESVRWLADKGRLDEASHIVSQMEADAPAGTLGPVETRYRADVKPTRFGELFSPTYRRRTVMNWFHWFTAYFVSYGFTTWLPTLYVALGGLPPERALLLSVATSAISLVVIYSFAYTTDRIGRKPLFIGGYAVALLTAGLGIVAVTVFHASGWPVLFAVGAIAGASIGVNSNGLYLYTPELYPTRMRAWATAVGSSFNRMASFIAPTVVGALLGAKFGIESVFAVFALMALIGLVVMITLGIETKQRVLEELAA